MPTLSALATNARSPRRASTPCPRAHRPCAGDASRSTRCHIPPEPRAISGRIRCNSDTPVLMFRAYQTGIALAASRNVSPGSIRQPVVPSRSASGLRGSRRGHHRCLRGREIDQDSLIRGQVRQIAQQSRARPTQSCPPVGHRRRAEISRPIRPPTPINPRPKRRGPVIRLPPRCACALHHRPAGFLADH